MGIEGDADAVARRILGEAGFDGSDVASPVMIAERLDIPVRKVPAAILRGADGMLCRVAQRWAIFVRDDAAPPRLRFVVAHELAERHLRQPGCTHAGPDKEAFCDAVAACLVAPSEPFRAAIRERGPCFAQLALDFATSQTCAALRYGELEPVTVGVDAPAGPRLRGPASSYLRTPEDVHRLATRRAPPGVHKVRLTDQRGRVALVIA